jgi:hypothetical protein
MDLHPGDAFWTSFEELRREVVPKPQSDSGDVSSHLVSQKKEEAAATSATAASNTMLLCEEQRDL